MKLILIYPDILKGAGWSGYYYTGIGYLSACVKRAGHEVFLIHVTHPLKRDDFMSLLEGKKISDGETLIAFSATTNMFSFVKLWASWIKAKYNNLIIGLFSNYKIYKHCRN